MKSMQYKTIFIIIILISFFITEVQAEVKTWIGGIGEWSETNNWSPPGVPVPSDDIVIDSVDGYGSMVILDMNVTIETSLSIYLQNRFFIDSNNILTIDFSGSVINEGMIVTAPGGTYINNGASTGNPVVSAVWWNGAGDGVSWFDPFNWSGDIIPLDTDIVILDNDVTVLIDEVVIQSHYGVVYIKSGSSLILENLAWGFRENGILLNESVITLSGSTSLSTGTGRIINKGIINNTAIYNSTIFISSQSLFINSGTINNSNDISNREDGTFLHTGVLNIIDGGRIINAGNFIIDRVNVVNSTGSIINSSNLNLVNGAELINNNVMRNYNDGRININDSSLINRSGSTIYNNGVINNNLGGSFINEW